MSAKARPADTAGASLNEEFHQIDRNFIFAKIWAPKTRENKSQNLNFRFLLEMITR